MSSGKDDKIEEIIRIGLDYGTMFLEIATQHIHPGITIYNASIEDVCLPSRNCSRRVEIAQISVDTDEEVLEAGMLWGEQEVVEWLKNNPQGEDMVVSCWKMTLVKEFRDREVVKRALATLLGDTERNDESIIRIVQIWITDHLTKIKADVADWYKTRSPSRGARQRDWQSIPWEVQIAVPASWGPDAANVMTCAAREAGFTYINTREEPQCVAGTCMKILLESRYIQENESVLFLDVGAGTSDAAIVKLRSVDSSTGRLKLERIGPSIGKPGGSLVINNEAWKYVETCEEIRIRGGMEKTLKLLGITLEECQRQLSVQIEQKKESGMPEFGLPADIILKASAIRADSHEVTSIEVTLRQKEAEKWYRKWVQINESLLTEILEAGFACHAAIFTGGGSRSNYLTKCLGEILEAKNIRVRDLTVHHPCSRGALQHYMFEKDDPIEDGWFYLVREEDWDATKHRGIKPDPDEFKPRRKVVPVLIPIMSLAKGEPTFRASVPMHFGLKQKGSIHLQVYYSATHQHPRHTPLKDQATGGPLSDLQPFPIVFEDIEPKTHGYSASGRIFEKCRHWIVRGFVDMEMDGESINLILRLMKPSFDFDFGADHSRSRSPLRRHQNDFMEQSEQPEQTYDPDDVLLTLPHLLWDRSSSHFVKSDGKGNPMKAIRTPRNVGKMPPKRPRLSLGKEGGPKDALSA